ncbi:MAG TPA: AI-2E family transporter [Gemmatimonadales bacterium]
MLDTGRQRATLLILLLGTGLVLALAPYASGLIGGLVLYVIFVPVHIRLTRRLSPSVAAGLMVGLALVLLVGPVVSFAGLLLDQAQSIATGVMRGPLLERLAQLEIGGMAVGPKLAVLGERIVGWLGSSAFGLLGHATRIGLNLTISLFVLYYLLLRPATTWEAVKPYIPFSPASAELLRERFRDVTVSTIIGTGLIAVIQGLFVAAGFWLTGLSNALFWGVVTMVFAILPVVGSGLVWGPGVLTLLFSGRYGAAIGLALLGIILVGNVDVIIRPAVFRRFAQVHPLVTLVGAIGGVGYFGLLGILIGPLAVSYFFELIRMFREEYLSPVQQASSVADAAS